jgi:S-DNA-T family DNA segregation ATPase FtsK/SpoIIIE
MFGLRKNTQPINPASLIESTLTYTKKAATRSTARDLEKIQKAIEAVKIPVAIEKFVPGIMYQYYMRPAKLTDYKKLVKQTDIFRVAFGVSNVRLYIEGEYVVLEVPGANNTVHVADILRSDDYYRSAGLRVAIGKKTDGKNVLASIETMPHMLIAGTTGSGKSVMMHQLIVSLLINHTPDDLQLYLVDPKMVEMPLYEPLRNCNVVSTTDAAIELLDELCIEMDRRYEALSRSRCRDIDSYNSTARKPMSRKVVFIDELADLILTSKKKVEKSIVRLAQKARACGIHLVIATQRPDRTVVTGLIKTNIPVKACLSVNTDIDSRIVLDCGGAEKLVGKGDMLYLGEGMIEPIRCQGGYISEQEIKSVVSALSRR